MVRPLTYHSRNTRRLVVALLALCSVLVIGTIGYVILGIDLLDATYQTVTTVTTIGFREVVEFGTAEKIFTMALALAGFGTVLYTLTLTLELVLEGPLGNLWGRRRMQRDIDALEDHAIVCGWGRVGRAAAEQIAKTGQTVVVVDAAEDRLETCPYPHVLGDATQDDVLRAAGIRTASTLVASLDNDAGSVYVVLSARGLNPKLFVIARSRTDDAEPKFVLGGADRVGNPQLIGGNRTASSARSALPRERAGSARRAGMSGGSIQPQRSRASRWARARRAMLPASPPLAADCLQSSQARSPRHSCQRTTPAWAVAVTAAAAAAAKIQPRAVTLPLRRSDQR